MICLLRVGFDDAEEPDEAPLSAVTDRLGNYRIQHHDDGTVWELGHGAMGVTYRAIDMSLQRTVALKLIASEWVKRGAEARERFMREARTAASLRHPNVATVYHFGIREENGQCFCAMELVEGETLEARVRRTGPLDALTTIEIALQVCSALATAEKQGLVHRDLKPANLMVVEAAAPPLSSSNDNATRASHPSRKDATRASHLLVKVIDFGVAKALVEKPDAMGLTHGGFVGTPAFASPEQFTDAPVGVRSDIYSLGATLWYLLTGHRPFQGATIEEIRAGQRSQALPIEQLKAARVPKRLVLLLASMLAQEPAARPDVRALTLQLQDCRAQILDHWKSARRLAIAAGLVGIALAAVVLFPKWHDQAVPQNTAAANIPEKSIAVLPFENRSHDPDNAYFADGIQDEILTRLSKIADLKVISRTSTQRYKSAPENLSEIARELGVAHILEGSVQKTGATVRVNVQLIKAANDSHLWADTFDRNLTDVLSVESEVAKAIADQLRAKLTGQEEQVIAAKPTDNVEAYDAYLRGLAYTLKAARTPANALGAQKYLREAVRLDPKFALAWALLARVNSDGYRSTNLEPTVALREEARQAAETALTLQPNLGEAILAQGYYHYACLRDYDTAVHYFQQARQLLPSSSRIPESLAFVARRRGQWDKSESYFNEAERLDPRNVQLLTQHALSYIDLRRFPEALRKLDQVLNITPDDVDILAFKANIAQAEGDLPRAAALLAPLHPTALTQALETQVYQAILERQPAPMIARLKEILAKPDPALDYIYGGLRFDLGWAQEVAGDHAAAQETWRQARSELESSLKEQPENDFLLRYLALTNMGLGDKAAALALTERDIAANPIEKDPLFGPGSIEILARVFAKMGEPDRAIAALQKLLSIPYTGLFAEAVPLTPALLRLDPMFDPLRNDPRFQTILASSASKTAAVPEKSIAVLPFRNLSEDKENAFFADGIQEELLNLLSKVPQLQVAARTSSFSFKGKPIEIPEIARKLHVANVLEGSVRKSGDQVRITIQLVRAAEGYYLWSETYDRKLDDIFRIQDEIAGEVVKHLKVTLLGAVPTVRQTDPKAYALYLRAVQVGRQGTPEAYTESDALYRQVLEIDPRYAPAWHELARNLINKANDGLLPNSEGYARAREADEKALSIDPDYAPAHAGLGRIAMVNNDFVSAAKHFERALALDPNDIDVLGNSATFLQSLGRLQQALALNEAIVRRDPANVLALNKLGIAQHCTKQFDAAIASFRSVLSLSPGGGGAHSWMCEAMLLKGDAPAALAEIEQEKSEAWRLIGLPMAYHALGRKTESDAALATLIAKDEKWGPYNIAYVYAFRGEADKAFEWLDKAVQYQDPGLSQIVVENLFDNIHSDSRWLPFLRKIGRAPEQLAKIQCKVTLPRQ